MYIYVYIYIYIYMTCPLGERSLGHEQEDDQLGSRDLAMAFPLQTPRVAATSLSFTPFRCSCLAQL
jgi:hypothetical protein